MFLVLPKVAQFTFLVSTRIVHKRRSAHAFTHTQTVRGLITGSYGISQGRDPCSSARSAAWVCPAFQNILATPVNKKVRMKPFPCGGTSHTTVRI